MLKILSIGTDAGLLYTRGLVLERTGAFVQCASPNVARLVLQNSQFDLIVLCHTVAPSEGAGLIQKVRDRKLASKVLIIGSPSLAQPSEVDAVVDLLCGPESLVHTAQRLLGIPTAPSLEPCRGTALVPRTQQSESVKRAASGSQRLVRWPG